MKLSILFQNFSEKINKQSNEINDNDREEFMKPILKFNANNEQMVIPSETSKTSSISLNQDLKKQNLNELICYTNEKRESPNISFYDAKKEEIQEIIEIEDDESKKEETPVVEVEEIEIFSENEEEELEEEDEFEENEVDDEPVTYKEDTPQNSEFKKQLKPQGNDIMSDFDEKTHGRKIEIFKKNTLECEKEDIINKDLNHARIEKEENKDPDFLIKIEAKIPSKNISNF